MSSDKDMPTPLDATADGASADFQYKINQCVRKQSTPLTVVRKGQMLITRQLLNQLKTFLFPLQNLHFKLGISEGLLPSAVSSGYWRNCN